MTTVEWTGIRVTTKERSAVIAALFTAGAESVQELDDAVVTHLRNIDRAAVIAAIQRVDREARVAYLPTPAVDWSEAWHDRITAHRLGSLVVTPPWLAHQFSHVERIVIDPGMAFGTGEHETTRGVIRLMQGVVRRGDVVADIGTGSAVLAIAAAKLGAGRVIAIEIDPDAIGNAEENVQRNGVADRVIVVEGDGNALLLLAAPVRVILANIVSAVLKDFLAPFARTLAADGTAIISGILVDEQADMKSTLERRGWRVVDSDEEGQWWSATIVRA